MFKNYLTYTLALSFHRSCCALETPNHLKNHETKERLLRSSEGLIHHFARSVHTPDKKEESRFLAVSLFCIRDCKEILEENKLDPTHQIFGQFLLLHGRLEQLCEEATATEGGQFRLFG